MPMDNRKTVSIPENSISIPRIPKPLPAPTPPGKSDRLSPGVYRNSVGMLVNRAGVPLNDRGQAYRAPKPSGPSVEDIVKGNLDKVSAGGNPNFDERTGQFNNKTQQDSISAALRAALGGDPNKGFHNLPRAINNGRQSPPQPATPPTSQDQSAVDAYMRDMARRSQQSPSRSALDGFMGSRPLGPNERAKYGIDPRDPNKYSIGPDGQLVGTYIGWRPDSKPLSELVGTLRGLTGSPQQPSADEQRLLDILTKIRF